MIGRISIFLRPIVEVGWVFARVEGVDSEKGKGTRTQQFHATVDLVNLDAQNGWLSDALAFAFALLDSVTLPPAGYAVSAGRVVLLELLVTLP